MQNDDSTKIRIYINIYIFIQMILPTYAYQQHKNWNSFNKGIEIDVQIKYEKFNEDDLH